MKCDEMVSLHCTRLEPRMTEMGQNEKPPFLGLRRLWPAADIPPYEVMSERCQ
jgi:hypothetical protein